MITDNVLDALGFMIPFTITIRDEVIEIRMKHSLGRRAKQICFLCLSLALPALMSVIKTEGPGIAIGYSYRQVIK